MSEREDTPLLERAGLVLAPTMPLLAWGLQTLAWDWISPSAFLLFYPAVFAAGLAFTAAFFAAGLLRVAAGFVFAAAFLAEVFFAGAFSGVVLGSGNACA